MTQSMVSEVAAYFQVYEELWRQQEAQLIAERMWTEDGFFIAEGLPEIRGKEALAEYLDRYMKRGGASIKHTIHDAEGSIPDNQIGYNVLNTVVSYKDGKTMDKVRSLVIMKKVGGELKIHGVMFNRSEQTQTPTA